jgi:hypothetical protein
MPCSTANFSVLRRALPLTKNGIFPNSFSASESHKFPGSVPLNISSPKPQNPFLLLFIIYYYKMKYIVSLAILALLSNNSQAISVKSLVNDADAEESSKNEAKEFFAEFKPQPS